MKTEHHKSAQTSAAIYCRASTSEDRQTLDQQIQPCVDRCKAAQWDFITYKEYASGAKESRPELNRMLQAVRQGQHQVVMVAKLDRLGRSLKHLLQIVAELNNLNCRLVILNMNIDTQTAQGKFFLQVMGAFAELERELISERICDKLRVLKRQGKRLGRPPGSKDKKSRRRSGYHLRWAHGGK